MFLRRRALSAGAVLTAAGAIVLSGSPAQADCSLTDDGTAGTASTANWQVGMQLGPAPVQLTGTGGLPALLLSTLPESRVAVRGVDGRNLVRLDATTTSATESATQSASLPERLPQGLDLDPITGVRVLETERAGAPKAEPRATVDQAAQNTAPTARTTESGQWEVLRADDAHSALGGQFAWVPIEGVGLLGADGAGLPWAGIALIALAGGTAAVTVVARHRSTAG